MSAMTTDAERQARIRELLEQIRAIDAELESLIMQNLGQGRPSAILTEIRNGLRCSTLWVLMLYQRFT